MVTQQEKENHARDEILAGEYVLGVLSADKRKHIEQRLRDDRTFANMVQRWEQNFSSFNDDYQSATVAQTHFSKIEARLFGQTPQRAHPAGLWQSLVFWRSLALGASAAALGAIVLNAGVLQPSVQPGAPLMARLGGENNQINLLASYHAESGDLRLIPVAAGQPEEKSLELWLVPGSGNPLSLGVIQPNQEGEIRIPAAMRVNMTKGAVLAVSVEPFGGSKTGLPTGPVVASGEAYVP